MRVKDLKKLLEEKFQDDDVVLIHEYLTDGYNYLTDEYNEEGNEYYEIEEGRIQPYIFDSEEDENYNCCSEKFKKGTRALLIQI